MVESLLSIARCEVINVTVVIVKIELICFQLSDYTALYGWRKLSFFSLIVCCTSYCMFKVVCLS